MRSNSDIFFLHQGGFRWTGKYPDSQEFLYHFEQAVTGKDIALLILLAFLALQVTPLPKAVGGFLSPTAAVVWEKSWTAASLIAGTGEADGWLSLAAYHYPVRMSIIRLTVYGFLFLGLVRVLNSQKRIETILFVILVMGCFEALYGLIQAYSGSPKVLWATSITDRKAATGTYINRNHFAGFMEMGMLLAAAFAGALSPRKDSASAKDGKVSIRARLSRFLSGEQILNKRILVLFAGAVMGIGLFFSASRGGILSAAGALLCLSFLFLFKKGQRKQGIVFMVLFLIISVYALNIGVDYVLGRSIECPGSAEDAHILLPLERVT